MLKAPNKTMKIGNATLIAQQCIVRLLQSVDQATWLLTAACKFAQQGLAQHLYLYVATPSPLWCGTDLAHLQAGI